MNAQQSGLNSFLNGKPGSGALNDIQGLQLNPKDGSGKEDGVYTTKGELDKDLPSRIALFRPDLVGDAHSPNLCPAKLEDNTCVVFVTPKLRNSELVESLQSECVKRFDLEHPPLVMVVAVNLLLDLRGVESDLRRKERTKNEVTLHKASFQEVMQWAVRANASDIHFNLEEGEPTSQIKFHIEGLYLEPPRWAMPTDRMTEMLQVAWQDSKGGGAPLFNANVEQQCRIETKVDGTPITGRWATMAADRGASVTIRILKTDEQTVSTSLDVLGYLPSQIAQFRRAQTCEGGLLCWSGVVGSGKSTTLATIIDDIPPTRKVVTMEDPVEYKMKRALQNTVSRKLEGDDNDVFHAKLMVLKRSAVQDVMFGEVRDKAGGLALQEILGMGTNCYTTVHAQSARQIPERLASASIGIPLDFLSSPGTLNLLVYQALLRTVCTHCSHKLSDFTEDGGVDTRGVLQDGEYWKGYIDRIHRIYGGVDTGSIRVRSESGCEHCRRKEIAELNGYGPRTVVAEMIEPNTDRNILRLIKHNDFLGLQEYLERLERAAFDDPNMDNKSIMECAVYKMLQGQIDPRTVEERNMGFDTVELIQSKSKLRDQARSNQ